MIKRGELVCVGIGMLLGAHLSPRARAHIESADAVYAAVSDGLVELWLRTLNPAFTSLQPLYREGQSRLLTYQAMVAALLDAVRSGKRVCGAFYGHPGVFAWVPHEAVRQARAAGFMATLEPGISAEDCLYADLGIDPGTYGCQHFEASQLMLFRRRIDPSAYLVVWQVGIAGDASLTRFSTPAEYRALLVKVLLRDYPAAHPVILYRAATLPIEAPLIRHLRLDELPAVEVSLADTLVIPPAEPMRIDHEMRAVLAALDRQECD